MSCLACYRPLLYPWSLTACGFEQVARAAAGRVRGVNLWRLSLNRACPRSLREPETGFFTPRRPRCAHV